ncbi:hypothetical protein F5882DRAFT_500081 [Hyaloscypha sp. PMI_1271]|nr:hypothetical protein F5882DRAFT_500081 [Hyaloscypha sp. PMI_1271]
MSHSDTDDQPESDDHLESDDQSESDDQDTTGQVSKLSFVDSEDGPCSECDGKGKKPRKEKKSLRRLAEDGLLKGISESVAGDSSASRYCCGGILPGTPKSEPTTLRWDDPSEEGISRKCHFPMDSDLAANRVVTIVNGICKASDKNGNLDAKNFSTNFDPHGNGILDIISQLLLPGFQAQKLKERPEHRGIKATLTNLQVCSAETPPVYITRAVSPPKSEFGKLVICLPHSHEGGKLEILRSSRSTIFDWSDSSSDARKKNNIKWAAFIGDCEFRIHPIREGQQFNLVYTLSLTKSIGRTLDARPIIEVASLPFYQAIREILEQPGFMRRGGTIGFYCCYGYNHTKEQAKRLLPHGLKGIDMVLYQTFHNLGMKVEVLPLFNTTPLDAADEALFEMEAKICMDDPENHIAIDFDNWQCTKCQEGYPTLEEYREYTKNQGNQISRVGNELYSFQIGEKKDKDYRLHGCGGIDNREWQRKLVEEGLREDWPWAEYKNVRWLNQPPGENEENRDLALLNLIEDVDPEDKLYHGVGEEIETFDSNLVILAHIPVPSKRKLKEEK